MKNLQFLFMLLVVAYTAGCSDKKTGKSSEYPMFWTWLDYRPGMNFDSVCAVMKETGLDGVMLNAPTPDDYRKEIPVAKKYGIEVYAWLWTLLAALSRAKASLNPEALADQFSLDYGKGNLDLSDYKLIKEYGYTKHYQVTEKSSKVIFDVIFYFYGGILSGWSAEPEKSSYEKYISMLNQNK